MSQQFSDKEILDLVGVGLGPANLSLAVVTQEDQEAATDGGGLNRVFLESKPSHAWHPGLLIGGSQLQINVLKDLILLHNPCSRFTFINYLRDQGRLYEFLNIGTLRPSRYEFNDYLAWTSRQLEDRLRYGRRVTGVEPVVESDGRVELLKIQAETEAGSESYLARNLVLATGGRPKAPEGIDMGSDGPAFHPHNFLQRIEGPQFADKEKPYRFLVVGGGQTAGELFLYLMLNFPNAEVTATVRRWAYKAADDTHFANQIFFPEMVDKFYNLPDAKREMFFDQIKDVNYAVIDEPLINRIYEVLYRHKVEGRTGTGFESFLELKSVRQEGDEVVAEFENLLEDRRVEKRCDYLVMCSGYEWGTNHPLLDSLGEYIQTDGNGRPQVGRDYRVAGTEGFEPGIYLQGFCEKTHGISETVLSLLPVRANEIVQSIRQHAGAERPEPALSGIV